MKPTRERILDAAAKLMRSQGLARTTTKAIAAALDLTEPALYRHFASKEELFLAVLQERLPPFIGALKGLPERVGRQAIAGTLEDIANAALAFFAETIRMAGSLFSEPTLLGRHRDAMGQGRGPQLAVPILARYLRAEQQLGRLPEGIDAVAGAAMLIGACFHRAFVQQFMGQMPTDREQRHFAKALIKTLLRPATTAQAHRSSKTNAARD